TGVRDQVDAGDQRLTLDVEQADLVVDASRLGGDDAGVSDYARLVLVEYQLLGRLRVAHGGLLQRDRTLRHPQRSQIVLPRLKGSENGLTIDRDGLIVIGARLARLRQRGAAVEQVF